MKRRGQTRKFPKIFIAFALLAAVILLGYKIYAVSYEKYQINQKVTTLDAAMAELGRRTDDLKALVGRFEDKDYIEKEARKKLNFQKLGEQSVIITKKGAGANSGTNAKSDQSGATIVGSESNPKLWYDMFFGK